MSEPPKKHIVTGIDISKLSRVSPTRIPSASVSQEFLKQTTNYRRLSIDAGILCLIVLLAYGLSTIIGNFVFNDRYIVNLLAPQSADESFWSNLIVRGIGQPLCQPWITSSFVCDLRNFGYDSTWYHAVNVILHALNSLYFYLLVYVLARHFWQDDGRKEPVHEIALFAAALFACHPMCTESVAHISGRVAELVASNVFLTLNFFLWAFLSKKMKHVFYGYVLTFIFFAQAIFSGVQALAVPAIMLSLAFLIKPEDVSLSNWFKERWGEIIILTLLMVLIPLLALRGFTANYSNGYVLPLQPWQVYVASQFKSFLTYYLRCFLLPIGLSVFPPNTTAASLTDPLAIIGLLIFTSAIYLAYRYRKKPLIAFGIGLAILCFLPMIFFLQNEIASDERFYLSIAGLALVLAAILKPWLLFWRSSLKVRMLCLLAVGLLSTGTILRSLDYKSDIRLFKSAIHVNENDAWSKGMLALALIHGHKANAATDIAKQAINLNQACQPGHLALGEALIPEKKHILKAVDKFVFARDELEKALSLAKSQHLGALAVFDTQRVLVPVLLEMGEYKEAKEISGQALSLYPNSNSLNIFMGRSLNGLGDYLSALTYLNRAYEHDRDNPDFIEPMAECALGIGSPSMINVAYNVSKMGTKIVQSHNINLLMAQSALSTGHLNEAEQWIEVAWRERPQDPRVLYLRGFILKAAGKNKLGELAEKRALEIDPNIAKKILLRFLKKDKSALVRFEDLYPLARKG